MNGTPSQTLTAITENLAQVGSFSHGHRVDAAAGEQLVEDAVVSL